MLEKKKTAIVYDWMDKWGGVERVLLTLHEMFPKAVFFTSYFDSEKAAWAKNLKPKTSFIQKLPKLIRGNRVFSLPFYPIVFESIDFKGYDLVISVTSSFAKSVITQPGTKHICYLLTPTRFLWSHEKDYFKRITLYARRYTNYLKNWDQVAAQRPDKIVSISETARVRCSKYYHRKSEVVYPPFDVDYWQKIKSEINSKYKIPNTKYYLIVSRLESYKKIDLAIKVFKKLQESLVIVGEGSQEAYLRKLSGKNISFLKKLSDEELGNLYSNAQALIMPQEEDFGFVSLESQFFGCPVISYKKGGARETIIEGKTGVFFNNQSTESLGRAIERFNKMKYNLRTNTKKFGEENVKRFNKDNFINNFKKTL
ncbi:glycosyltransferase [Candidatus Roizmanbacteria bacterium]|nr:glycosyltransferase [Candidatus Roizmanbacteria bacterium]